MAALPSNPLHEIRVAAARFTLGLIHSWEIPPIADRALSNGVYTPALAELATLANPIMSDVDPLLVRALAELGMPMPSRADAAWLIARDCMHQIVSTPESLWAALWLLDATSKAVRDVLPVKHYWGDNLDLGSLLSIYCSYPGECVFPPMGIKDNSQPQPSPESLAHSEARAWLERHPESPAAGGHRAD